MRIETWHRHHALLMASNFPSGIEDARIVLKLLTDLVEGFLADPEPNHTERANVVTLVKADDR